ncbi:MAG: restriction endonuclease subunit S [Candidatus Marinimicrobia bacterium]|nr:restriction endonuclease subunit S [Candidatus Neomarinimicrobiota bacterium]
MNAQDMITEHLDIWTTAQEPKKTGGRGRGKKKNGQSLYGIKKLRELILDLAVRGKLVEQNPEDEPASVLLEKIAAEKARLIEEGKIKKQKKLSEITEEERPFDLPDGWEWVRLIDIGYNLGQTKPEEEFTYIDVSSIDNVAGTISFPSILSAAKAPSRARKIIKVGTVIYSTVRPYLQNICVIDQEYNPRPIASTAFAILHPFQQMPGKFFVIYLRSPIFTNYVELVQTGIAYPAINDKRFFSGLAPLPPLPEQHRIVTKVDELMALCDQLEQQQTTSNATHQTLLQTLLATLIASADHEAFTTAWERIASHFDLLFTTEQSIDQLKQTILQLAVMGKLVPQHPEDEPASLLLEKIAQEKARLIKEGKIKKQKKLPAITEEEKPFALPEGWEWVRLNNVLDVRDGTHDTPKYVNSGYPLITSKNLYSGKLSFEDVKYISTENHKKIIERSKVDLGDILFAMIGSIGNPVIVDCDDEFSIKNVALFKFLVAGQPDNRYLYFFLLLAQKNMRDTASGAVQNFVSLTFLRNYLFPLPPIEEQHRIVAKVDELMALCDHLKTRLHKNQTTKLQLADTIVKLNGDHP